MDTPGNSTTFFLQLGVMLFACRVAGGAARRLGQPEVVGHMAAGILLGPSFLGAMFPEAQAWVFPETSRGVIYVIAQLGLVMYMFLAGLEFRTDLFRKQLKAAAAISAAGMVVPFGLGVCIALWLFGRPGTFCEGVDRSEGMLFLGAAMSITAFPMMARMIAERGLSTSGIGTLILAAGAIDDAAAWCVLGAPLGLMGGTWWAGLVALGGALAFVTIAAFLVNPLLRRCEPADQGEPPAQVPTRVLSLAMVLLACASWFTNVVGVHAVFGSFVLGAAVPRGQLSSGLLRTLTPVVMVVLLPMNFISSGLSTQLTLLNSWASWTVAAVIVLAACGGKLVACAVAARMSGQGGCESLAIGAMMNARGLMELIILNIGLERGLITPTLYSTGVLMALVTTLMATPMFDAAWRGRRETQRSEREESGEGRGGESTLPVGQRVGA